MSNIASFSHGLRQVSFSPVGEKAQAMVCTDLADAKSVLAAKP
jgi:hypothetical protein